MISRSPVGRSTTERAGCGVRHSLCRIYSSRIPRVRTRKIQPTGTIPTQPIFNHTARDNHMSMQPAQNVRGASWFALLLCMLYRALLRVLHHHLDPEQHYHRKAYNTPTTRINLCFSLPSAEKEADELPTVCPFNCYGYLRIIPYDEVPHHTHPRLMRIIRRALFTLEHFRWTSPFHYVRWAPCKNHSMGTGCEQTARVRVCNCVRIFGYTVCTVLIVSAESLPVACGRARSRRRAGTTSSQTCFHGRNIDCWTVRFLYFLLFSPITHAGTFHA